MDGPMTNAADQGRARSALTYLAQVLRPDWDPPGIVAAVDRLHRDGQPLGLIARATISAALTPSTKTPGGIAARVRDGFDGAETPAATPTAPAMTTLRCGQCGFLTVRGEIHTCGRIADPPEGRARAQAQLDAARADLAAHTTDSEETP
jgi:uncharacterized protein YwbE